MSGLQVTWFLHDFYPYQGKSNQVTTGFVGAYCPYNIQVLHFSTYTTSISKVDTLTDAESILLALCLGIEIYKATFCPK